MGQSTITPRNWASFSNLWRLDSIGSMVPPHKFAYSFVPTSKAVGEVTQCNPRHPYRRSPQHNHLPRQRVLTMKAHPISVASALHCLLQSQLLSNRVCWRWRKMNDWILYNQTEVIRPTESINHSIQFHALFFRVLFSEGTVFSSQNKSVEV